jgi:TPR repeat protein
MKIQSAENTYSTNYYLELAQNNDDANAQNTLGTLYISGTGVPQHYGIAVEYFKKSAEQNNADAIFNLGVLSSQGVGVDKSAKIAFELFSKAADLGHEEAQINQAVLYMKGEGVEPDLKKAFELFSLLADKGNEKAQNYLAKVLIEGTGCEVDLAKSFNLLTQYAQAGNAVACVNLAAMYTHSVGCEKDSEKAVEWLIKASETENVLAQSMLSGRYRQGDGCDQNSELANKWLDKAITQGCPHAQYLKAKNYYNEYINEDKEQHEESLAHYDCCREDYNGFDSPTAPSSLQNALAYFYKSAKNGHKNSQLNLSKIYTDVNNLRDVPEAYIWSAIAATSGLSDAIEKRQDLLSLLAGKQLSDAQDRAIELGAQLSKRNTDSTLIDSEYLWCVY